MYDRGVATRVRFAAALLLLAGCPHRDPWPLAGDGGPADAQVIPTDPPDAKVGDRADARPGDRPDGGATVSCDVRMNLGALGTLDGEAQANGGGAAGDPDIIYFLAQLDDNPKPDMLQLELYKGFGAFASGTILPGTFGIVDEELNYATCGVCVRIMANHDPVTGEMGSQYLATGGSVSLTSVAGNLTGSLNEVRFETVVIDPTTFESRPVNDGCVTSIDSVSFDSPIAYMP